MSQQHPITPPPPHLLKKFSAQAQAEANKRNGTGYLKTVATLCIEWFVNSQSTSNDRQIRSSEIEPPRELVEQWVDMLTSRSDQAVFTMAAQWGADNYPRADHPLRAARRPKPPSLKEQALAVLDDCANCLDGAHENTIRRALEALDD